MRTPTTDEMRVVAHYLSTVMNLHSAAGKLLHHAQLIDAEIERSIAAGELTWMNIPTITAREAISESKRKHPEFWNQREAIDHPIFGRK